jgi:L-ascorbate metabolism protein UlaG (beta-lactamase superfamily)
MQIIGEFFPLDVALIPIGDRYTMGLRSATRAVEYLKPKRVIPMHYNTFPLIEQNPEDFKNLVAQSSIGDQVEVAILKPGETLPV